MVRDLGLYDTLYVGLELYGSLVGCIGMILLELHGMLGQEMSILASKQELGLLILGDRLEENMLMTGVNVGWVMFHMLGLHMMWYTRGRVLGLELWIPQSRKSLPRSGWCEVSLFVGRRS